jgi:hypothetical protein
MSEYTYLIPKDNDGKDRTDMIVRSDNAYIPTDPANSDYQAYLAYVANGNKVPSNSSIPQAGE